MDEDDDDREFEDAQFEEQEDIARYDLRQFLIDDQNKRKFTELDDIKMMRVEPNGAQNNTKARNANGNDDKDDEEEITMYRQHSVNEEIDYK